MHSSKSLTLLVAAVAALLFAPFVLSSVGPLPPQTAVARKAPGLDVPYVPTPQAVVDKMLEIANVTERDYVIDLGSGDGRIPVTAAKRYRAKALGVDLDPARIKEANENAKAAGVTDKVQFRQQDLFDTDISGATVLTMYLLPSVNMKLRSRIQSELKPGTRVVSHSFDMGDWKPDRTEKVDGRTIYMWTIPDRGQQRAGAGEQDRLLTQP